MHIPRVFFSLERIKTYLTSTMRENRLNRLEFSIILLKLIIKPKEVINMYADKHPRCICFL